MKHLTSVAAAALLAAAGPLHAQPSLALDLSYNSHYVSRGLSMTSRPVAQGTATLTLPVGGVTVTGGAWGNLEPAAYTRPGDLSMTAGETGPNLTEVDFWADASVSAGPVGLTAGVLRMTFPNEAVVTSGANTTDVYARVALSGVPLSPRVAVNYDVGVIRGAYVEGTVSQEVPVRGVPVTVGASVGWSDGQALREGSAEGYAYARDGLTHGDAWVSAALDAGRVKLSPVVHVVIAHDELTRAVGQHRREDVKVWMGLSASWSTLLARR